MVASFFRELWVLGRLAVPALLYFLDVLGGLGGGISRLTRRLTPSHWRQPRPLPGGERWRGAFPFSGVSWRGAFFTFLPFYPFTFLPLNFLFTFKFPLFTFNSRQLQHAFDGFHRVACDVGGHIHGGPFVAQGVVHLLQRVEFHVFALVA